MEDTKDTKDIKNLNLQIEYLKTSDLVPYERNAREHHDEDVDMIVNSIKQFGFNDPIGVWKDNIVVEGHGRLLAAKKLGMKTVPCVRLDHLTDEERRAYALAHNKTAENSMWNLDFLDLELDNIFNIDMTSFGFEQPDNDTVIEDNYEPELPVDPKSKVGDIYQLGRHRLMCGDSTNINDVEKLLDGAEIDMLLTDPPYNVDIEETAGKIMNDNMDSDKFREFLTSAFYNAKQALKLGGAFHVWYGETEAYNFRGALYDAGLKCRQQLIWVKSQATLGKQDFQHQYESVLTGDTLFDEEMEQSGYEPCLYGWKDGSGHVWRKKRKEKDVLFFDKPLASKEHPTMKPILLFDYEMKCNTSKDENILDLFGGSGTTIMAAEQNGRNAFVMEYDPRFVDVILSRYISFVGSAKNVSLLKDGKKIPYKEI